MNRVIESVYTDGSRYFVSNPTPKKGEEITIKIRMLECVKKPKVILRFKTDGAETRLDMIYTNTVRGLDYYEAKVVYHEDRLEYNFIILYRDQIYYYNQLGISEYMRPEGNDFVILYNYDQPSWIRESVFYQIFPDRFCNGNKENDVKDNEYYFDGCPTIHREWNDRVFNYKEGHCLDFYGGDLEGIKEKIPYLKELGVTALYLNPIFYAATNHRYDCLDYFRVDPHLGGDEALISLVEELHKNDMKIILDVSINHTGTAHIWFNKECVFFDKSVGAYNNVGSKEREYYFFDEDNRYKAWFDFETLPTLNYTSKALREIIFEGEDSLVKHYLKAPFNIDGWRFDVADVMARNKELQLHHDVWPKIRQSIKSVNPNAYILGEDWSDCHDFLMGNEWDSAMNYFGYARPIREFLGLGDIIDYRYHKTKIASNAKNVTERIREYLARLPYVIWENQFNLFDSHDIGRLHNRREISFTDYRTAVIGLFTIIGAPSIYYADEANVGGSDSNEGCRYPYPWDKLDSIKNSKQYNLYKTMAHLKRTMDSLRYGGMTFIKPSKNVMGYVRHTLDEGIVTILARNDKPETIKIDIRALGFSEVSSVDYFNNVVKHEIKNGILIVEVEPNTSLVFKIQ